MRVVVTGATGNVGAALLRAAAVAEPGWQVVGVARRPPPARPPFEAARWESLDVGAPDAAGRLVEVFAGADAVIHLAWAINPGPDDPPMWRTNLAGAANVLRAVAAAGTPRLVCASSVAVYSRAPRWRFVSEGWQRAGVAGSAYSQHKAAFERMLDRFQRVRPSVAVARIRPCGIVTAQAGAQLASWMASPLLGLGAVGGPALPAPVWRGLRFQLLHADDVADAIHRVVATGVTGAFNLASGPVLRRADLAAAGLARLTLPRPLLLAGAAATWRAGLQPAHPGWLQLADRAALVTTGRADAELGWSPRVPALAALAEAVSAIRAANAGDTPPLRPRGVRQQATWRPIRAGRPLTQSQNPRVAAPPPGAVTTTGWEPTP